MVERAEGKPTSQVTGIVALGSRRCMRPALQFAELPSRLEQFDRIAVWVFHLYLSAGRANFHCIAEVNSRRFQRLDEPCCCPSGMGREPDAPGPLKRI
jgi:hypothetical protein